MKLIEPKAELILQQDGLEGVYKQIEIAGRVCYHSENRITEDSAEKFYKMLVNSGHYAMLEHGTVYLDMPITPEDVCRYSVNPYSKARVLGDRLLVTTNCRVIKENKWDSDLNYLCTSTEHHEMRYTMKFTTDRGVSHELVRHRVFSFAQESTRYCNYSRDKFGGEIFYIVPSWFPEANMQQQEAFMQIMKATEDYYMALLGQWDKRKPDARFKTGFKDNPLTPQQARQVLPNALKTEICMTGFESDWKHFFDLRLYGKTGAPHPDMKALATLAMQEFNKFKILISNDTEGEIK